MSEEINKMLDELVDDFKYILNKYIDLLEKIKYFQEELLVIRVNYHENKKALEQAKSVNNKYFNE